MEQQHVSTFASGMHQDSHPSLQPKNTYRDGLNGNLVSHDGNHYSFESTEGTVLSWSMPLHITNGDKFMPIGLFRMGDRLIVHSTKDKSAFGGDGEIGIVNFNNSGVGTYTALYYHSALLYSQMHMIVDGYGLEENDSKHRAYWTDDFNQPRTMNIANPIFTTNIPSGSLIIGQTYMVLTDSIGHITYDGVDYGPQQAAGNIFLATVVGGTAYTVTGTGRVIDFIDPNVFNYTPEKAMGTIDFVRWNYGGQIWAGVKLYAYRLSTKDGYESSWTFTTNPIHVTSDNPNTGTQNYQGKGYAALVNSTKSIDLLISDIPQEFDNIQVAVIEVDRAYEVIRSITIFWDSAITGTSMTITHKGNEDLSVLLIDDLSLTAATIMRCKCMTTVKQRQEIGNITSRSELDFHPEILATATPFTYTLPCDTEGLSSSTMTFNVPYCPSTGIASGNIVLGGHYVVRGGSIQYPLGITTYNDGETFVGTAGNSTFNITVGTPIVKGCIRIKRYNKFAGGQDYQIIELNDDFFDYKGMASTMYLRSHWRLETYRYGALAWDKFGNPYAVRWIKDVTMPSHTTENLMNGSATQHYLNALGIEIGGIDITEIRNDISAISIVRVQRDATILAQGLIMQTVEKQGETLTTVPIASFRPGYDDNVNIIASNATRGYIWNYLGPEADFGLTAFDVILTSGDNLQPVADYSPLTNGGYSIATNGVSEQIYSKYYNHNNYTNGGGSGENIILSTMIEPGTDTSYTAGGFAYTFKNYDIGTGATHSEGLGGGVGSMVRKSAAGSRKTLMIAAYDYVNGLTGQGTGVNTADIGNTRRLLANYVRPKAQGSLYGGTSDSAKANNQYQFTGHYLKITSQVLSDIEDATNPSDIRYVLNGMEVWGGDCFVQLYSRANCIYHRDYEGASGNYLDNGSYSWGLIFPVESNINTGLREGRNFTRDGMHNNTNGVVYSETGTGTQRPEEFNYNESYSTENDLIKYDPLPVNFMNNSRFPYMVRYSEFKNLGETIDNMRRFLINNFRNVDALHGEINNLMVGGEKLFYLQRRGVGYIPIEERETTASALGLAIQLGVGGVAQRFDTMDTFYGCQHQSSLIKLENKFIFWDMSRYSIISLGFGGNEEDNTVIKGMQSFFQNAFISAQSNPSTILNIDQPLLGNGVVGIYDPIKKTAYITFKFSNLSRENYTPKDFTIGISSQVDKFIGFFSFTPSIYTEINSRVYMVNSGRSLIQPSTSYIVGSEVSKNGQNYVCVLAFTTLNPVSASQQPDFAGSTFWVPTSAENQIYRMYAGSICNFFNIVYPHYISIVVNPQISGQKSFDHAQSYGNEVKYSSVYCSTSNMTSEDVDITPTNKSYRFYDGKWNFSYPLYKKTTRLTDEYMVVKLYMKNWSTSIITSLNLQKRIVYLKSIFRFRK